jgi:hypothetical protein
MSHVDATGYESRRCQGLNTLTKIRPYGLVHSGYVWLYYISIAINPIALNRPPLIISKL